MVVKPLADLFAQGGPVMVFIAGASVLAWYLALRTWWAARRHLIAVERIKSLRAPADRPGRFGVEIQAARLEHTLRILGALAMVLPLLGLLGTVLGMLAGFDVIQLHGTGQPRLLARGIGQALMTTQAGLWTAVPVLFFHHILRNRVRLLRDEIEMLSHAEASGANRRGG